MFLLETFVLCHAKMKNKINIKQENKKKNKKHVCHCMISPLQPERFTEVLRFGSVLQRIISKKKFKHKLSLCTNQYNFKREKKTKWH